MVVVFGRARGSGAGDRPRYEGPLRDEIDPVLFALLGVRRALIRGVEKVGVFTSSGGDPPGVLGDGPSREVAELGWESFEIDVEASRSVRSEVDMASSLDRVRGNFLVEEGD